MHIALYNSYKVLSKHYYISNIALPYYLQITNL